MQSLWDFSALQMLTTSPFAQPSNHPKVGVHIADVTHFIRPGTAVDLEAAKRGTTVYLTNRR